MGQAWISAERIEDVVQLEPALIIVGLILAAALIYKIFLRNASEERHKNLRRLFNNLGLHSIVAVSSFIGYYFLMKAGADGSAALLRVGPYVGFLSIISWSVVFIKVSRILLFEYLFLSHMRVGVPLLLVNLFSLLTIIVLGGWLSATLLDIKLVPLLTTSAIFSLVLGLALQDTLGNLFAGVSMQFDKPYQIGDWIEIFINGQKWVGKVDEISWRATVLVGISDESISVPNRLMGQTQISNFTSRIRPFCRSQLFRISHGTDVESAKMILLSSIRGLENVLTQPSPIVYVFESNESWINIKLVYYIEDYGSQFVIGDRVVVAGNKALQKAGFTLAPSRMLVLTEDPTSAAQL